MTQRTELEIELACVKEELKNITEGRWLHDDPRHTIYKRCNIIILRPAGARGHWHAGTGYVETKNGWSILTSFEDRRVIDEWDKTWLWSRAPGDKLGPSIE
jgi:hypothetical protein